MLRTDFSPLTSDPRELGVPALGSSLPAPRLPRGDPAQVPVAESGEALAPLPGDIPYLAAYHWAGWPGARERSWLRVGVIDLLRRAQSALPSGFGLAVFDAWRHPRTIRALHDFHYGPGSSLPVGFVADPDDPLVVPPHQTGGAVDLTLTWQGRPLALGTAFDDFTPAAALHAAEGAHRSERAGDIAGLRRLLAHTLAGQGFVGMDSEWWHVSWGDQRWAADRGVATAPYGAAEPPE